MSRRATVVMSMLLLTVAACGQAPSEPPVADDATPPAEAAWNRVEPADMTPVQHDQQQRCVAAKEAMFEQLMGELQGALADGGPGDAIEVCSMRAPEIAAAVANQHGVRIGRTSFKLRNQANLPPDWAEPLVAERVAEATWLAGPDGELAGLLPIRLKAPCVTCHGPRDELPQPVQAALADLYPADEATGFAPGDLRGWFWVEAPTES